MSPLRFESLVGIGPEQTTVRVIVDPTATVNSHEVVAEGAFGRMQTVAENLPSPRNAKSSYLSFAERGRGIARSS